MRYCSLELESDKQFIIITVREKSDIDSMRERERERERERALVVKNFISILANYWSNFCPKKQF
jgi:hypothetical protein